MTYSQRIQRANIKAAHQMHERVFCEVQTCLPIHLPTVTRTVRHEEGEHPFYTRPAFLVRLDHAHATNGNLN